MLASALPTSARSVLETTSKEGMVSLSRKQPVALAISPSGPWPSEQEGRGPSARHTLDRGYVEIGRPSLLEPYPLGVALLEKLDLLELLASFGEVAAGGGELRREVGSRHRQIIAPRHRRLGEGRIGVMIDVGDAGAFLLDGDLPVEIGGHVIEVADHRLDFGDLPALLFDFEALQADQCVA